MGRSEGRFSHRMLAEVFDAQPFEAGHFLSRTFAANVSVQEYEINASMKYYVHKDSFSDEPLRSVTAKREIANLFRLPLDNYSHTQNYNDRSSNTYTKNPYPIDYHLADDVDGELGITSVYSAANGTIVFRGTAGSLGNTIVVEHTLPDGTKVTSLYAHLDSFGSNTLVGTHVSIGHNLGKVGNTGIGDDPDVLGDGSHLHFAMYLGEFPAETVLPTISGTPDDDIAYSGFVDPSAFIARMNQAPEPTDQLMGTSGNDHLFGEGGNDSISGGSGADFLHGGVGDDNLDGGTGTDFLVGSGGGDRYHMRLALEQDTIDDQGGEGSDVVILHGNGAVSSKDQIRISRSYEIDALVEIRNANGTLIGNFTINDFANYGGKIEKLSVLDQNGQEVFFLSEQELKQKFFEGSRVAVDPDISGDVGGDIEGNEDEEDLAGDFPDDFTWTGNSSANEFSGSSSQDVVAGLGGGDDLVGRDGDDWFFGGDGDDYLNGGEGNDVLVDDDEDDLNEDTLYGDDGDDFLIFRGSREGETDKGDGASGYDIAIIDFSDRGNEDWDLVTDSSGTITIDADNPNDGGDIELRRVEVVAMFFGAGDDRASGRSEVNYVRGGDGDDDLNGGAGDDILYGEDDDDEIEGGSGEDWLDGGDGTDLAILDLSADDEDMVFIASHAEDETGLLLADGTYLRNFEQFHLTFGDGNDQIWLGELGDEVFAGSGNDVISLTGRGRNVIQGNSGIDRVELDYSWATDEVNYGSQSGDRTFYIGSRYADATDRVRLGSVEEYSVIGGQFDDSLYGGDVNDELFGGQGNDRLDGNDGNDYLSGGSGDDVFELGKGVDWVDGGSGSDTGDIDRADSGLDFIFDYRLAASGGGVTLIDGTFIRSVESWESLAFGMGDDSVTMNVGTTRRYDVQLGSGFNHLVIDHEGQTDVLTTRSGLFNTQASYLAYRGPSLSDNDIGLWGRQVDTVTVLGGFGADSLAGLAGSDVLSGNGGDDLLEGEAGDDFLSGGLGNDLIDGGSGQDILIVSGAFTDYRLLLDGDDFILKGLDGGDYLTGVETIRFSDGRVLELNRMYGLDSDGDGEIPEHLLSGSTDDGRLILPDIDGSKFGDGPLILPDVDKSKFGDEPLILPDVEGSKFGDEPLILPGVDASKFGDGPLILPGVDGSKLEDEPLILPGLEDDAPALFPDLVARLDAWRVGMEPGILIDEPLQRVDPDWMW